MSLFGNLFGRKKRGPAPDPGPKIVSKDDRAPIHDFQTELVGVELENPDDTKRQDIIARASVGAEIILLTERRAMGLVSVYIAESGQQIGFLPRETSTKIKKEARGYDYRTYIDEISEPAPETGVRGVTLTVEVFEKPKAR